MDESQKHHLNEILKQAKLVSSHRKHMSDCLGLEVVRREKAFWSDRKGLYLDYGGGYVGI